MATIQRSLGKQGGRGAGAPTCASVSERGPRVLSACTARSLSRVTAFSTTSWSRSFRSVSWSLAATWAECGARLRTRFTPGGGGGGCGSNAGPPAGRQGCTHLLLGRGQAPHQLLRLLVAVPLDVVAAALPVQAQLHLLALQALLPLHRQGQLPPIPGAPRPADVKRRGHGGPVPPGPPGAGLGQGRLAAVCHGPRPAGTFTTWVEERQRLGRAQGPRDGKGATELERRQQLVRTGGDRADRLDTPESSTAAEGPVWAGRAQSAGRTRAPRLREPHAASREPERSAWAEKPPQYEGEARHSREATPRGAGALVDVVTLTRADTDDARPSRSVTREQDTHPHTASSRQVTIKLLPATDGGREPSGGRGAVVQATEQGPRAPRVTPAARRHCLLEAGASLAPPPVKGGSGGRRGRQAG